MFYEVFATHGSMVGSLMLIRADSREDAQEKGMWVYADRHGLEEGTEIVVAVIGETGDEGVARDIHEKMVKEVEGIMEMVSARMNAMMN